MAVRDQLMLSLRALTLRSPSNVCRAARCFSTSSVDQASTVQQRRRRRDPYALAQAKARKAANMSRQVVLRKERADALGDPVRGSSTPFVESFDTGLPPINTAELDKTPSASDGGPPPDQPPPGHDIARENHLNFFLDEGELKSALERSEMLSTPSEKLSNEYTGEESKGTTPERHANATEALKRIAALSNASSKDRLRVNIQKCISAFGRHNTDHVLLPKAPSIQEKLFGSEHLSKVPRAGPDTGSSEVQIGILTAKIRALADFLQTRGKKDKVNKRNLRLLVHKRQKLLKYLKAKERGGPRWQNLIETLGLTPGTYEGEISM